MSRGFSGHTTYQSRIAFKSYLGSDRAHLPVDPAEDVMTRLES